MSSPDIVLVSNDYLPNVGGVATHVHELARACSALGHRVHVLSTRTGTWNRISTWRARERKSDGMTVTHFSTAGLPGGRLIFWRLRRQAREYVRRVTSEGATIFHVHDCDYGEYVANYLSGGPRIFTNHTSGFLQDFDDEQIRSTWLQRIQKYDHVIAPSSELAAKTRALGYPAHQVSFIPNGVEPERFRPDAALRRAVRARLGIPADHVVVLVARRFVPKNGVIDFAHAVRHLAPQVEHVTLVFAGNGDPQTHDPFGYEKECLSAIRTTPLGRRALFLGPVANSAMHELYASADMSVLPSLKEATSISGLEAMSTGLPLVGTRVGGIPELIDHEATGLLVAPGDPRELADAIARLARDTRLRTQLGANARRRVLNEFTWRHVATRTIAVYTSLLPGSRQTALERSPSYAH